MNVRIYFITNYKVNAFADLVELKKRRQYFLVEGTGGFSTGQSSLAHSLQQNIRNEIRFSYFNYNNKINF